MQGEIKVNCRRIREAYYYLKEAGLYEEAMDEMCSLLTVLAFLSSRIFLAFPYLFIKADHNKQYR